MFPRVLTLAAAGVAAAAAGWSGAAVAADRGELQGHWMAVRAERDGREAADIVGHLLVVDGETFRIEEKGATIYEGTLRFDESGGPGAIDFRHTGHSHEGKTWRGIYKIDGETLTICDNAGNLRMERPTTYATGADSGLVLVVFKRARP